MNNAYYSVIGILAVVVQSIINNDLFRRKDYYNTKAHIYYRQFLVVAVIYYAVDTLWGIFDGIGNARLLYADTILYYLTMVLSVIAWCRFVIEYLQMSKVLGKIINVISVVLLVCEIILLFANHFYPIFFSIDSDCTYHAHAFRYGAMALQILLFFIVSLQALVGSNKCTKNAIRRHHAIGWFSVTLILSIFIQLFYPNLPIYTVGILVGTCVVHAFVLISEREEAQEILEEKQQNLEEAAQEQESQLEEIMELNDKLQDNFNIIDNAGYGIWRIRLFPDGKNKMSANEKLQKIFGIEDMNLSPEELYTYYHDRLFDDTAEIEQDDYASMMEGELRSRLLAWNHPTKGTIYLRAGGTSHTLENGVKIISGYCGDITETKLKEDELSAGIEAAKYAAEAANNAKTTFLLSMSHDIRTPMNAITGFTELMGRHLDDREKCKDYLEKINNSCNFLLSLINNVLEVARIESGETTLDETPIDLDAIGEEIRAVFAERFRQKNITFKETVNATSKYAYVDTVKVKEIYLNLLSNAYKYTPEGGSVTVATDEIPSEKEGYIRVRSSISDTGIGMTKEFLPHVFDEFSRAKSVTEDKIEGTGLGMPIVKKLVGLMGGSITVESEVGKGTTFTVEIEHRKADWLDVEKKDKKEIDITSFEGKRILLAEDNDLNAEIAIEVLKDAGFEVERAEDGVVCVDMLRKAADGYYSLVLMDIQMPNMDGYGATKVIRAMEENEKKSIPIVAMTANAFDEDKQKAIEFGMNGHLSKPIRIDELFETIANLL